MRHAADGITDGRYTDRTLIDCRGAMDLLLSLSLDGKTGQQAVVREGTSGASINPADDEPRAHARGRDLLARPLTPRIEKSCTDVVSVDNPSADDQELDLSVTSDDDELCELVETGGETFPRGLEPLTFSSGGRHGQVQPPQTQALTGDVPNACTPACYAKAKNEAGGGSLASALAMIAGLPLTPTEKAEAVRRLLAEAQEDDSDKAGS